MLRKAGVVLTALGIVLFILSFLHVVSPETPSSCTGSACFHGPSKWVVVMPASIFAFVGGVIMLSFAGQGIGASRGPRSFEEVDSGAYTSSEPTPSGGDTTTATRTLRWSRSWRNIYVYTGLGEVGLALLFLIGAIRTPEVAGGFYLTAAILGTVGVVLLAVGYRAAEKDRLHFTGVEGSATIVSVTQTGMLMNNNPYVRLGLRIAVPGHPEYEVKHGEIVPLVALGRLTSGATLPVKVDPNHPSHFVIEWERT